MIFFATASANQNDLVEKEVKEAGATDVHISSGGVEFEADLETAYKFALWTRCATRLLVLVYRSNRLESTDDLYEESLNLPWENWINPEKTFAITETVTDCRWIRNSHFAALRFKDAIVERVRGAFNQERPSVNRDNPDITFHLHVNRNLVSWYVDFAGRNLAKRGYRTQQTEAVMSEFMACSILYRSDWYRALVQDKAVTLLDPFCGSSTICIEAALMATNTAPGLVNTERFAFFKLPIHDDKVWQKVLKEAEKAQCPCKCKIFASDIDEKAIEISQHNANLAGVSDLIDFSVKDFTKTTAEDVEKLNALCPGDIQGCIVTDPPYGIRLDAGSGKIRELYQSMGSILYDLFGGWNVAIICPEANLLGYIDMKPDRTNVLMNGGLECQVAHYYVFNAAQRKELLKKAQARREERLNTPLSAGSQMAANRIAKNMASIGKDMKKQGVTCYRLYDADMPEYSAAIDVYENQWICLQEYAAPSTIKEEDASRRLEELVLATERTTGIDYEKIYVKRREIQKGDKQYTRRSKPSESHFYVINENGHRFHVNFADYLDTGIFLDHRPVRKMIENLSENKRFLNLFCYTGTATVHAAAGGALSTVSVDASATYLDWAMKNMRLNGFTAMNHFYYKKDCISYLKENHDTFDLIFCDPPTFSNSKSRNMFDVQKDHGFLIRLCMKHLSKEGTLIFSTNYTKFKMYEELADEFEVEDITDQTIGEDFKRNKKIHYCYTFKHKTLEAKPVKTTKVIRKVVKKTSC